MNSPAATPTQAVFHAPGQGQAVWFLTNRMTIKATAASTGGAYGMWEAELAPGFSTPMHVHHRDDEAFWVLDGELTMRCGDRVFRATTGAFVFLPREVPHAFTVEGNKPARMLALLTPGGGEQMFIDAGRPVEHDGLPAGNVTDIATLKRVSEQYGAEIVGPPPKPAT